MWLVNARTVRLEEFARGTLPPYAILSHSWGRNEVTFKDLKGADTGYGKKEGYSKILMSCQQAVFDELDYVWIDTCCIDEADMTDISNFYVFLYKLYHNAETCYVFLEDVPAGTGSDTTAQLSRSVWFTRIETLQELIAPRAAHFYSQNWKRIGDKKSLAVEISQGTGIPAGVLLTRQFLHVSVAERMSWASRRRAAVEEDTAYCLQGIFGVRIAPNYGEGGREAFQRLQEAIIQKTGDESMFVWNEWDDKWDGSIFAKSSACYRDCGGITACRTSFQKDIQQISLSESGVWMRVARRKIKGNEYGLLQCRRREADKKHTVLAIPLTRLDTNCYCRAPGPVLQIRLTAWARFRASYVLLQDDLVGSN